MMSEENLNQIVSYQDLLKENAKLKLKLDDLKERIRFKIKTLENSIPELRYYSGNQFVPAIETEIATLKWVLGEF